MKSKLFLIAMCVGLQVNMSFASEKQSWGDWFRAKFMAVREKAPTVGFTAGATMATAGSLEQVLRGIIPGGSAQYILLAGSFGIIYSTLGLAIDNYISNYQKGSDSRTETINKIKNDLTLVISNPLLYPTRSSKIHALLKKDEFLQYLNDQDNLVQEACAALSKEISSMAYSDEQRAIDRIIDEKMNKTRQLISSYTTLDDQIKELEKYYTAFSIPEMQAHLSIYFRLKNKQAVEKKRLAMEARSAESVSEPSVD